MQVILTLSPARVQPLSGAGRKESLGTGLKQLVLALSPLSYKKHDF